MAAKLESMGFEDEALSVLGRLDALTPLEREVLRLMRILPLGVKVDMMKEGR